VIAWVAGAAGLNKSLVAGQELRPGKTFGRHDRLLESAAWQQEEIGQQIGDRPFVAFAPRQAQQQRQRQAGAGARQLHALPRAGPCARPRARPRFKSISSAHVVDPPRFPLGRPPAKVRRRLS